jgi:TP901 family phage tail tape measure protein
MADVNSNIFINIDTAQAMSALRGLDNRLSAFNRSMIVGTKAAQVAQADFTRSLLHNVNATGSFNASMATMTTSVDQFGKKLESGKLGIREYYRYGMASTKTFGRFFGKEFENVGGLIQRRIKTLQNQYVGLGRDAQGAISAMRITPKKLNYDDQLTRMQMTIQRQQIFNKLLDDGSTKLLNFGKNTQWAGRQLMVGFTIPLAMFGAAAIKSFKEIETQAIRFKKVYGELFTTGDESDAALENMKKIAQEFTKYGVSVADTIKVAADAAAAGASGKDLEVIVTQANKLAVLGGIAQDKSFETIIALRNAFEISSSELGKSINFLNAVENQTVLSLEDITEAVPRVGPIIRQLGGDVQDLAVFLTAMKEGGVSAAQGANALKSGLASLINPSTAAVKATNALGINLKAIVETNAGDLNATVMSFANAIAPLSDLQRGQVIEQIFGKYQFARISALFNNITKDGTQANRVMKLATASAEELTLLSERELKTQESSAMNKMQQQIEKLKASIAPIGEVFAKSLTPVIEFFVKLFNKFNEMPDGIKRIVALIVAGVAGIGPIVLMTVGLVANGIANLIKMFSLVRQGYQKLAYGSKDAALGTRYMTQEELENTAVTNALTTSHKNLSAAYVLESSSLRALTAVYQQANVAMSTFARNNPGMFMPGLPKGGGRPPLRYNKGVSYVPGTGNTDTVPAILTPGEAVIPKPMVAKYGGLVDAMVKDQIPGYMAGYYPSATAQVTRLLAGQPGVVGRAGGFGAAGAVGGSVAARRLATIQMSPDAVSSRVMQRVGLEEQGDLISVTMGGAQFFVKKSGYRNLEKFILENEKYQTSKGASVDDIFANMVARVSEPHRKLLGSTIVPSRLKSILPADPRTSPITSGAKARRTSYLHKKKFKELETYFKGEEAHVRENMSIDDLAILAAPRAQFQGERVKDAITRTGDKNLFSLSPALSHGIPAKTKKRTAYDDREDNLYEETNQMNLAFAYNGNRQHVKSSAEAREFLEVLYAKRDKTAFDRYAVVALEKRLRDRFYDRFTTRQDELIMANKGVLTPGGSYGNIPAVLTPGEAVLSKDVVDKYQPLITAMSEGDIPGYANGVVSVPGPKGAGDIMPAMLAPGEAVIPAKMTAKYSPLISGMVNDSIPGFVDGIIPFGTPESLRPGGKYVDAGDGWGSTYVAPTSAATSGGGDRVGQAIDKFFDKPIGRKIEKFAATFRKASPAVEKLTKSVDGVGDTVKDTTRAFQKDKTRGFTGFMTGYGNVSDTVTGQDGTVRKATQSERTNMRQDQRMQKAQRSMGVGMLAMMAPMVAMGVAQSSPDSTAGQFAQKHMTAIMGLSMLPMLLPLLNSPIKKLSVGIIALIALYKIQSMQIKKSIQDGIAQGQAMGNTVKTLEEFGNITGNMSSTQIQDEKRKSNARELVPVDQTFGRTFAGSEFGKTFIEDFMKSATVPGVDAANILGTKLAGAVSQGVLTSQQADSIIVNIARANNDQRLELDARAVLRQVIGPDGQDLLAKPLKVQTRMLLNNKEIQSQVQLAFANVVEAEMGGFVARLLSRIPGSGKLGVNTGINRGEALQLGGAAVAGAPVAAIGGIRAAGLVAGIDPGEFKKTSGILKNTRGILTGLQALRTGATVAAAGTAATGIGIPAAVGLAASTAIIFGIELGVRKFQQGQEKKKVGALSGAVAGSSIQNLQAVQQSLDAISETEDMQIAKLKTELDIAKTAEKRLEIEQKMLDVRNKADSDRGEISKVTGDIMDATADFYNSITSKEARDKVKESYNTAFDDFFKDAVGSRKQASRDLDVMLNPDAGLLKTEGLRGAVDPKALADAQKSLEANRAEIAKQQAIIAAGGTKGQMDSAREILAKAERFTPLFEGMLAEAQKGKVSKVTEEQSLIFRAQVQSLIVSGVLSVESAQALISTINANEKDYTQALKFRLDVQGGPEVERLGVAMTYLKDNDKKRVDIATEGMSAKELNEFNNGIEEFIKLPDDIEINMNLEVNGKQDIDTIKKLGKEITALKDQFPDGKITKTTLELYQKTIGVGSNATLDSAIENFELIQKYAPELQLQAAVTLQTLNVSDSFQDKFNKEIENEFRKLNPEFDNFIVNPIVRAEAFNKWKATEEGKAIMLNMRVNMLDKDLQTLFAQATKDMEAARIAAAAANAPKRDKSWIDDLLLRLKLTKEATIDAKKGLKELEKYLGSKARQSVNPQLDLEGRGLINQIEAQAKRNKVTNKQTGKTTAAPIELSQDFMDLISSFDVDQLDFFIKDYLKLGEKGNVIGFEEGFKILNEGFKIEGISMFLRNSKDTNTQLEQQNALFTKLTDPMGRYKLSVEQAAVAMEDASLAGALMRKDFLSEAELKALNVQYERRVLALAEAKKLDMTEDISRVSNQTKAITLLTRAGVSFTDALDISKIKEYADEISLAYGAADLTGKMTADRAEEIRNKFKGYIADVSALRKAIFNLEQQSETRSDKLTDEFAAEEARITLAGMAEFRAANQMSVEQFNFITKEKEALQAEFQDQIDEYSDGISAIEKLEKSVNEKYDEKIKLIDEQADALDKVLSINEDIAAQQQGQLTIADALTQGDISAAAKAAADYSAQQAEVASRSASEGLERQRSAMEAARQKEIDRQETTINGKVYTRKQLEEEINKIQDEKIKKLEKEIKDRNELVAKFELGIEKQIKAIELQGVTAGEWGSIKEAVEALNDAYDAEIVDINSIATAVGGVSTAWAAVATAIKDAGLELGNYPGFTQISDAEAEKIAEKKAADAKAAADKAAADKAAADKAAADAKLTDAEREKKEAESAAAIAEKKAQDAAIAAATIAGTTPADKAAADPNAGKFYNYYTGQWVNTQAEVRPPTSTTGIGGTVTDVGSNAAAAATIAGTTPAATATTTPQPTTAREKVDAYLKKKAEEKAAKAEADRLAAEQKAKDKAAADERKRLEDLARLGISYQSNGGMVPKYMPMGGLVPYMNKGGIFKPKGTDTIPAMLTPGEFVVRKSVVDQYGPLLEFLNNGTYKSFEAPTYSNMSNSAVKVGTGATGSLADNSSKVYNYNVGISVNNTNADADDIAKAVMSEIKYIDSQRLRGQR